MKRKRWKLWTAVASGLVSVGGGGTYYLWPRPVAAVAETAVPKVESPHARPPDPIPDAPDTLLSGSAQFVAPASFNDPGGTPSSAGSRFDSPPPRPVAEIPSRPTFTTEAPQFDPPPSGGGEPAPYRGTGSDQETVPQEPTFGAVPQELAPPSAEFNPGPLPSPAAGGADGNTDPSSPSFAALEPSETAEPAAESSPAELPGSPTIEPLASAEAPAFLTPAAAAPEEAATEDSEPLRPTSAVPPQPEAAPDFRSEPQNRSGAERSSGSNLRATAPRNAGSRFNAPPATLSQEPALPLPDAEQPGSRIGRNASAIPRASRLISNAPGERQLEGLQAPSLTVQRSAPEEIQVGKPTKFVIRVKNVGQVPARDVIVSDQIPQGTRFLAASPEATPTADGVVAWELGALLPNQEVTLSIELLPESEGEIGSVAEVTFRTQAAVRTIATKPLLKVEHSGPATVLIGEEIPFQITVANPGSGVATGVVIEVDVPEGLAHDGGREIMSDRFDLRPNETRKIDLVLKAVAAGPVESVVRAVGDTNLQSEHRLDVEVIAPKLQLAVAGPSRRFLDRPVKYQIGLSNPGTAPAQELDLMARLPRGLKFVSADQKGEYDPRLHAVMWSLEELPPGEQGIVELTAVPVDPGEQKLHVEARGGLALEATHDHTTIVEEITDLAFTVTDENVPIEVGSDTTYQIRVANNGTKVASNIRLAVVIPEGLEVIDSDGPTAIQQQANQLVMQPIAELGQREEAVYRIAVKGTRPGDHVVRVQLLSDAFSAPVTKEEVTKVYADK